MIKNKDPRIKQIRESFCRLKAQLLLNFMILKIPMGSALCRRSLFSAVYRRLCRFTCVFAVMPEGFCRNSPLMRRHAPFSVALRLSAISVRLICALGLYLFCAAVCTVCARFTRSVRRFGRCVRAVRALCAFTSRCQTARRRVLSLR